MRCGARRWAGPGATSTRPSRWTWSKALGGPWSDQHQALAVDGADYPVLLGVLNGPADLGDGLRIPANTQDPFVAKLAP